MSKSLVICITLLVCFFLFISSNPLLMKQVYDNKEYIVISIGMGSSMEPRISQGDRVVILVKESPEFHLSVGDVAVYVHEQRLIAHRVIAIQNDMYLFKGDNVPHIDQMVSEDEIFGKVIGTVERHNVFGLFLLNSFS